MKKIASQLNLDELVRYLETLDLTALDDQALTDLGVQLRTVDLYLPPPTRLNLKQQQVVDVFRKYEEQVTALLTERGICIKDLRDLAEDSPDSFAEMLISLDIQTLLDWINLFEPSAMEDERAAIVLSFLHEELVCRAEASGLPS